MRILFYQLISLMISCKSTRNEKIIEKGSLIELKLIDYSFNNDDLSFNIEIINNSKKAILILKPNDRTYGSPDFYYTKTFPEIERCEFRSTKVKPLSHIIEILPNSKQIFEYKSAFFGACDDINDKEIKFQVTYEFDFTKNEILDYLNLELKNDEKKINAFGSLTTLNLKSNIVEIKMP